MPYPGKHPELPAKDNEVIDKQTQIQTFVQVHESGFSAGTPPLLCDPRLTLCSGTEINSAAIDDSR